jgi:UDP-N-acetylmuramate--alanine ligase
MRVETYGESADATLRVTDLRSSATFVRYLAHLDGEPLGEISLPVPGRHLGLNSAAAVLTAVRLGLPARQVADALAAFPGVRRRFELKGVADGVRVYDEYAYHPTAMTAALETLREVAGTHGCSLSSSRTGSTARETYAPRSPPPSPSPTRPSSWRSSVPARPGSR